jgi:hypothetical protein
MNVARGPQEGFAAEAAAATTSRAPDGVGQAPATGDGGPGFIQLPNHRPFVRCPLTTKYERVSKVGQGTFG